METIIIDPEICGGKPVFAGSRVPIEMLFNHLLRGTQGLEDFLENYPTVEPESAKAILRSAFGLLADKKM